MREVTGGGSERPEGTGEPGDITRTAFSGLDPDFGGAIEEVHDGEPGGGFLRPQTETPPPEPGSGVLKAAFSGSDQVVQDLTAREARTPITRRISRGISNIFERVTGGVRLGSEKASQLANTVVLKAANVKVFGQNLTSSLDYALHHKKEMVVDAVSSAVVGGVFGGIGKTAARAALTGTGGLIATAAIGAAGGALGGAATEYLRQRKGIDIDKAEGALIIAGLKNEFRRIKAANKERIRNAAIRGVIVGAISGIIGAEIVDNPWVQEQLSKIKLPEIKLPEVKLPSVPPPAAPAGVTTVPATPTVEPTATPAPVAAPTATVEAPTATPTAVSTPEPTATPTVSPTATPTGTPIPTETPTPVPAGAPTPEPAPAVQPPAAPEPPTGPSRVLHPTAPTGAPELAAAPPPAPAGAPELPAGPPGAALAETPPAPPVPTEPATVPPAPATAVPAPEVPTAPPVEVVALPEQVPLPAGSNPWEVTSRTLRDILGRDPTKAEILQVTKEVCRQSNIAVPNWEITGEIDHSKLPVNYKLVFNDPVKKLIAGMKG